MKLFALAFLPAALALPHFPQHGLESGNPSNHGSSSYPGRHGSVQAAYFLDNDPAGSSLVSLKVGADGKLSDPVRTSTGGIGSIGTNTTGFPNAADSLMSQGSVVVSGNVCIRLGESPQRLLILAIDALHRQRRERHRRHVSHRPRRSVASSYGWRAGRYAGPISNVRVLLARIADG